MNTSIPSLPPKGRIHVLQVIGNAIVGGMESYVMRLIEGLPRERFVVTALCPDESALAERLRALDVEVVITPMPDNPPWCSIQLACSLVTSGSISVLHAHLPNAHVLAGIVGKLVNRPVLSTIHGRQLTPLDVEVQRVVGSHLSLVCRQSYFHALGMGINAAQLSCILSGVDTERFSPPAVRAGGPLRAALGLAASVPLVGFVGRLSPEKGPEVFVRAALLLAHTAPHARCVIVGDGPMRPRIADMIERLGLSAHVHMIGTCDDMPSIYAQLDVLVSSSHSEAMPLALMEGMACGLPVVATRVGGVPELVVQGETGWLVEAGDFEGIAAHVVTVLQPDRQARMGAAARRRAVERFSLPVWLGHMGDLLTQLASPRRTTTLAGPPASVEADGTAAAKRHQTIGGSVSRSK